MRLAAPALVLCMAVLAATEVSAAVIQITADDSGVCLDGATIANNPGVDFALDFTGKGFADFANADLHTVTFFFTCTPAFTTLNVQFDGLAQPVAMQPLAAGRTEYLLYDPLHKPQAPIGAIIQIEMDPALEGAFKDGKLTGNLWIQSLLAASPTNWSVQSEATFAPEPAALSLLLIGGSLLIRPRRRGAGTHPSGRARARTHRLCDGHQEAMRAGKPPSDWNCEPRQRPRECGHARPANTFM